MAWNKAALGVAKTNARMLTYGARFGITWTIWGEGAQVKHVKAHTSKAQQQPMSIAERKKAAGNSHADERAKDGADMDGSNAGRATVMMEEAGKVKWALRFIAEWHVRVGNGSDTQHVERKIVNGPRPRTTSTATLQHVMVFSGGLWRCARCQKWTSTEAGARRLRDRECPGTVVHGLLRGEQQTGPAATINGHHMMRSGRIFWCNRCGRFAEFRCRGLRQQCPGRKEGRRPTSLHRLLSGKHPLTGFGIAGQPTRISSQDWEAACRTMV